MCVSAHPPLAPFGTPFFGVCVRCVCVCSERGACVSRRRRTRTAPPKREETQAKKNETSSTQPRYARGASGCGALRARQGRGAPALCALAGRLRQRVARARVRAPRWHVSQREESKHVAQNKRQPGRGQVDARRVGAGAPRPPRQARGVRGGDVQRRRQGVPPAPPRRRAHAADAARGRAQARALQGTQPRQTQVQAHGRARLMGARHVSRVRRCLTSLTSVESMLFPSHQPLF